ncbi:MAG: hypothetical protein JNK64_38015 [Myxococcales bacterium]|nr:hypothetical protein [Myxococcales bacterium]
MQIAAGMHLTRAISMALCGLAACAEPPDLAATESADQTRLVLYVRAANPDGAPGSDSAGDGTLAAPYRTVRRALAAVPLDLQNTRYVIDCTGAGVEDVGPDGLVLPPIRSNGGLTSMPSPLPHPSYDLEGVLTIHAVPTPLHAIAVGEPVVLSTDPGAGLVRLQVPGRAWAVDAWKGMMVSGAGRGQYAVIAGNTADTLQLAYNDYAPAFTPPLTIETPSCGLANATATSTRAAVTVRGMTGSLVLAGLRLAVAHPNAVALIDDAPVIARFQAIDTDGLATVSGAALYRTVHVRGSTPLPAWPSKNVGRQVRRVGGTHGFVDAFFEDVQFFHGGGAGVDASTQIGGSILDRCAHVGEDLAEEGYSGNWEIQNSWLRGTRGHGFAAPAAQRSYLFHVRIDDSVGDAIRADGPGYLALMHVTGGGNGGVGVRAINGGAVRIADPPTRTTVAGTAGELQVGGRARRSWLGFRTEAPAYSEADFAADTGDGSRIWEEPSCCGLWTLWGQGASHEFASNHALAIDSGGDVVAGGQTASPALTFAGEVALPGAGGWDGFVVKRGPTGAARWARRFGEVINAVAVVTTDGSDRVAVVGSYAGATDLGGGPLPIGGSYDALVVMLDADGRHLWSTGFGGPGYDRAAAVAIDPAGDVLVVHNTDWNPYGTTGAMTLTKLAGATGAIVWQRPVPAVGGSAGFDLATGADGDVYLVGSFGNPGGGSLDLGGVALTSTWFRRGFVARLDGATGLARWAQAIDNSTHSDLYAVAVAGDAVFVGGASRGWATLAGGPPVTVGGEYDFFVARLTAASGAHVWSHAHGGPAYEQAFDVALDPDGTLVATGMAASANVDFGGGPLAVAPSPAEVVVARYDQATGAYRAAIARGSSGDDVGVGVAVDPRTRNVIVAGYASGGFAFGDGWDGDALGGYGVFVTALGRL